MRIKITRRKDQAVIDAQDPEEPLEEEIEFDLLEKDAALIMMLDNIRKELRRLNK